MRRLHRLTLTEPCLLLVAAQESLQATLSADLEELGWADTADRSASGPTPDAIEQPALVAAVPEQPPSQAVARHSRMVPVSSGVFSGSSHSSKRQKWRQALQDSRQTHRHSALAELDRQPQEQRLPLFLPLSAPQQQQQPQHENDSQQAQEQLRQKAKQEQQLQEQQQKMQELQKIQEQRNQEQQQAQEQQEMQEQQQAHAQQLQQAQERAQQLQLALEQQSKPLEQVLQSKVHQQPHRIERPTTPMIPKRQQLAEMLKQTRGARRNTARTSTGKTIRNQSAKKLSPHFRRDEGLATPPRSASDRMRRRGAEAGAKRSRQSQQSQSVASSTQDNHVDQASAGGQQTQEVRSVKRQQMRQGRDTRQLTLKQQQLLPTLEGTHCSRGNNSPLESRPQSRQKQRSLVEERQQPEKQKREKEKEQARVRQREDGWRQITRRPVGVEMRRPRTAPLPVAVAGSAASSVGREVPHDSSTSLEYVPRPFSYRFALHSIPHSAP